MIGSSGSPRRCKLHARIPQSGLRFRDQNTRRKTPVAKNNAGKKARVIGLESADLSISAGRAARARTATATAGTAALGAWSCAKHRLRLHRQQAFALQFLAGELARTAHGFGLFAAFFSEGFS